MIGTKYLLTLLILISLILPLQSSILIFADGQMKTDSILIMYDNNNSKHPQLIDSKNTIIKPKIDVSIEGTPNDDQLKGGSGDDKISGEDGNDTISGKEGNDKINGGKDDDVLHGDLGNDTLKGENGEDKMNGGNGNDLMEGGKGDDILLGGKGNDGMLGDEGNDVLNGGEGFDIMAGGLGNDIFVCDLFDRIIDFNSNEGDKIVGQCSILDQTEIETSIDNSHHDDLQSASSSSHSAPFNHQKETSENFQSGPQPTSPFSHDNIRPENFRSSPPFPMPSLNETYISGL
jgi:Ca2+-binding RTX toxin-like protein